jgi:hypothetical protein
MSLHDKTIQDTTLKMVIESILYGLKVKVSMLHGMET